MIKVEMGPRPKVETKVYAQELKDRDLIGVEFASGARVFVIKVDGGHYISSQVADSSGYTSKVRGDTIQALLKNLGIIDGVYVFPSRRALGEWLIEKL